MEPIMANTFLKDLGINKETQSKVKIVMEKEYPIYASEKHFIMYAISEKVARFEADNGEIELPKSKKGQPTNGDKDRQES
jgi:hypothetical protein